MSGRYTLETLRVMEKFGWSRSFALEYVMARHYHGMSHDAAVREARKSPYVHQRDMPR
jgi:hypothetical protein